MIIAAALSMVESSISSFSESEWDIYADIEDSAEPDGDPELGRADYWECVKCKNKQNNPMYRFCEKCYQVGEIFWVFPGKSSFVSMFA